MKLYCYSIGLCVCPLSFSRGEIEGIARRPSFYDINPTVALRWVREEKVRSTAVRWYEAPRDTHIPRCER